MERFWRKHPALFYGFAALLGCFAAFHFHWLLLAAPLLFFFNFDFSFSKNYWIQTGIAIALAACFYLYAASIYKMPALPLEGITGRAHIQVHSFSTTTTHYGKQWVYKGTLSHFVPERAEESAFSGYRLPYKLILPSHAGIERPLAHCDYVVKGCLKPASQGQYLLHVDRETPWSKVKDSWSLGEWRHGMKRHIENYIRCHIQNPLSATFLTGMATGEFDDRHMQFEFGRFGLQHIMAISGFHFAILASILGFFFRMALPQKIAILVLLLLMSLYFLVLGPAPSVMRAWIAISASLGGFLLNKRSNGLNSLGFAMLLILICEPVMCCQMGFQLSFLATLAILMLYSGIDNRLQQIFFKRPLSQAILLNPISQHGYLLLGYCRQGLALMLSVHLATFPLVLYHFHKFSLIGIVYNLFFPFMVSICMLLLVFGTLASLLFSPVGDLIHSINSSYTGFVLDYLYNMPGTLDMALTVESIPLYAVIFFLSTIFYFGVWLHHEKEKKKEEKGDFNYI